MDENLFPDLAAERDHLARARRCRDELLARHRQMLAAGSGAADEITGEYVEVTLRRAITALEPEDAADFFGRIDGVDGASFHIGKRHIEDAGHEPVVIDWRAPVAAPFYRATLQDPCDLRRRRRFVLDRGDLVAYHEEHLDHPDAGEAVGGVPDPVLAELGAARTGAMREIVATIQAEQDLVIRSRLDVALVVQGGPGTGKTAVGLHRAAFLLFEHRARLEREGVLVVGPNRVFLDYVAGVLPSLGEQSVEHRTLAELAVPRLAVDGDDQPEVAALKGEARLAAVLERAAVGRLRPPDGDVRFGHGVRTLTVAADELAAWQAEAMVGRGPLNRRREGFRHRVAEEIGLRTRRATGERRPLPAEVRRVVDQMWPKLDGERLVRRLLARPADLDAAAEGLLSIDEQRRLRRPAKAPWTTADVALVDEARGLVDGAPASYGHVIVDEAQDLTPLALRMVARRAARRSLTVLGDLAQATTPGAPGSWEEALRALGAADGTIARLSVGYRVPAPILQAAERLLALAEVDVAPATAARPGGLAPGVVIDAGLWDGAVAAVEELRRDHALTGMIVPDHRLGEAVAAVAARGHAVTSRIDHLLAREVPVLAASAAKGLELDGVVVADPAALLADGPRGARLLYIAMTRAVQRLVLVAPGPLPAPLDSLDA